MRSSSIFTLITPKDKLCTVRVPVTASLLQMDHICECIPENVVQLTFHSTVKHLLGTRWQEHRVKLPLSVKGAELKCLSHSLISSSLYQQKNQTDTPSLDKSSLKDQLYKPRAQAPLLPVTTKFLRPHRVNLAPAPWSAGPGITTAKIPHAFKHQWP